jgi:methionyl-tRNA formyltransferase
MRLVFAGTPEFAATALGGLLESGFEIALVLTQPDRPAGRGLHPRAGAVKALALAHHLPLAQPASLKDAALQDRLRALGAAAMVVAAYGLILPPAVLAIPSRGCLNIHASLLPRWRGAAPIQRALLAGDTETGITIMQMDDGLDTGAILLQEKMTINDDDTAQTLQTRLASLGARCIVRALRDNPLPRAQDDAAATYAAKISKAEAAITWSRSARDICRQIRAFNPVPGAVTTLNGAALKIWRARPADPADARPGTVVSAAADGIVVAAGDGTVCITELQKAGGKRLSAPVFLAGSALAPGTRLGA